MSAMGYAYFYLCATFAILGAIATVAAKNPIRGAMGLLLLILSIAGLFLALHAQFLAAIQLIVYAGAIVVLFLFVIMLLGPSASTPSDHRGRITRVAGAGLFAAAGLGAMALLVGSAPKSTIGPTGYPSPTGDFGSVDAFGRILFSQGLVPFELSSALLMVAIVGAVAVARGRHKSDPGAISGAATLEAENVPHAGQAPRTAGGITREAP
ncbi:MAG: NADH-quinone oxidoreductase subunit J [Labilithrix sp.]|nr:NADH-quinone oxidoreductase subunit J [Labilithrix sp.]MBX3221538.1 NADH-quinone oxidoreductase subunit J [Labilithrix sp.]